MKARFTFGLILGFLITLPLHNDAHARPIPLLSYDDLFKQSDLVMILRPLSVRDAKKEDRAIPPKGQADTLVGVVTRFQVSYVVKGEYKQKNFELVHYRLNELIPGGIVNGPTLASFVVDKRLINLPEREKPLLDKIGPHYMVFLKKQADGRFACLTGEFDAGLSVREIRGPLD